MVVPGVKRGCEGECGLRRIGQCRE